MLTFLDFFSGIGGFRLGMEQAGHKCLGHCEIDKYANISYNAIHQPKEGEWFATDIRGVNPGELPEADCYCGGFPCQSFSVAGKRGGFEDTRGTLFFEVMRLAAVRKPKYLFLENVTGLLSHDGGRTFGTIINTLGELGYDAEWQILNSKDHGVPQNRERVFIIGHLGGYSGRKVFPITRANGQIIKQIGNIDQDKRERVNPQTGRVYATDGISPCLSTMQGGGLEPKILCINTKNADGKQPPQHDRIYQTDGILPALCAELGGRNNILEVRPCLTPDRAEKRQNGRRFKEPGEEMFTLTAQDIHGVMISEKEDKPLLFGGVGEINFGKQYRQGNRVYDADKGIAMCLHAQPVGNAGGNSYLYKTGCRIRKLTPRECFRLQGFPDWVFDRAKAAGISDSQLYKQAGNSVTVNVINAIAKRLGEVS